MSLSQSSALLRKTKRGNVLEYFHFFDIRYGTCFHACHLIHATYTVRYVTEFVE